MGPLRAGLEAGTLILEAPPTVRIHPLAVAGIGLSCVVLAGCAVPPGARQRKPDRVKDSASPETVAAAESLRPEVVEVPREGPVGAPGTASARVLPGIDVLIGEGFPGLQGRRLGLITNASGVDSRLRPTSEILAAVPGLKLVAIFAPEHGVQGALQAGMEVGDLKDPVTGAAVHSLYGSVKKPTGKMLEGIDLLIYDIQDVGARPYTYLSTLRGALEAAAEAGIEIWVLDRPDPLGGQILDGPVLSRDAESFVGPHEVPLRHGLTPGEFARMMNAERGIGARLKVVALKGWKRGMAWRATGLSWVAPSPNIPTPESCLLFPGFVLLEGTNLSEGRGTTRPFQLFGAPWLDARRCAAELNRLGLEGVIFRATEFIPSDSKHRGKACGAVEVHVRDPGRFRACAAAVAAISVVRRLHPRELRIEAGTFDRLSGGNGLRLALERGDAPLKIAASWTPALADFRTRRGPHLLYGPAQE